MDLTKMENNHFKLTNEYFDLGVTIYHALENISAAAQEKKLNLSAKVEDGEADLCLIQSVLGDQRRIFQCFLNFLTNALKFTDAEGYISIGV
jgi:signal transduction histidine kinase